MPCCDVDAEMGLCDCFEVQLKQRFAVTKGGPTVEDLTWLACLETNRAMELHRLPPATEVVVTRETESVYVMVMCKAHGKTTVYAHIALEPYLRTR